MTIGYSDEDCKIDSIPSQQSSSSFRIESSVQSVNKVVEIPFHRISHSTTTDISSTVIPSTSSLAGRELRTGTSAFAIPLSAARGSTDTDYSSLVRSELPSYISDDKEALLVHKELEYAAAEFKRISNVQVPNVSWKKCFLTNLYIC